MSSDISNEGGGVIVSSNVAALVVPLDVPTTVTVVAPVAAVSATWMVMVLECRLR